MTAKILVLQVFFLGLIFTGCTSKNQAPSKDADGRVLIDGQKDPAKVVIQTEVVVPEKHRSAIKKSDLLIWDLRDGKGGLLAGGIQPVPQFPHTISVTAGQLKANVGEGAPLLFYARIVKFGEENKPPKKGQLQVSVSLSNGPTQSVVNPNVDEKRLERWMKKTNFQLPKSMSADSKVKVEFAPILF